MSDSQNKNYNEMSESEKKKEDWMNNKWRPMMGWMYMVVCMCDFVLFPVLWGVLQTVGGGKVETQWMPITLQGAGLFHIAMGAILGIAAYGRTQEKLGGANNGGLQVSAPAPTPSFTPAPAISAPKPFTPAPYTPPAPVAQGFGGKAMPPPAYEPEL
jgi:hypothetical protein